MVRRGNYPFYPNRCRQRLQHPLRPPAPSPRPAGTVWGSSGGFDSPNPQDVTHESAAYAPCPPVVPARSPRRRLAGRARLPKPVQRQRPDRLGLPTKAGDVTETFDGKTETSDDGRYSARDGCLTVNFPKGRERLISALYTVEEFPEDFTLKLEFRASNNADSGIFIRKPQLQCRDYLVAGPYKS